MKNYKGFSLLEILIALAILVVGVASVVNMFPIGLHAAKRGADFSSAGILAQEKMAEIMYLGYGGLGGIEGIGVSWPGDCNSGSNQPFPSPDDAYSWYLVLDEDVNGVSNLAEATLQIFWNDRGTERNATFITYIADRD